MFIYRTRPSFKSQSCSYVDFIYLYWGFSKLLIVSRSESLKTPLPFPLNVIPPYVNNHKERFVGVMYRERCFKSETLEEKEKWESGVKGIWGGVDTDKRREIK